MKIKELVALLEGHDPEAEVSVNNGGNFAPLGPCELAMGRLLFLADGFTAQRYLGGWQASTCRSKHQGATTVWITSGLHAEMSDALADARNRLKELLNG